MLFSEIIVKTVESPSFGQNAYVVHLANQTDCLIIDPGFDADRIVAAVKEEGLNPKAVLITHGHVDHIAGIRDIRNAWPKCEIGIGADDAEKLTDPAQNLSGQFGYAITAPTADRLFKGGEDCTAAGITFHILHIPGHSRGQVAYLASCTDRALAFVGDIIFSGSVGRADFPDGDFDLLIAGIKEKLLTLPKETLLYPGHGPSTTVGEEARSNPFLC